MVDNLKLYERIKETGKGVLTENSLYIPLRFTGTGMTDRDGTTYFRDIMDYDYNAVLGTPVTVTHPNGGLGIFTDNNLIIGSIVDVWNKDNIVNCIAKINDSRFFDLLDQNLDTSPSVITLDTRTEGGIMIEQLKSIDHLAILVNEEGYWTKYNENQSGFQANEVDVMPMVFGNEGKDDSNTSDTNKNFNQEVNSMEKENKELSQDNILSAISELTAKVDSLSTKIDEEVDKRKEIDDVGGFLKSKGLDDEDIRIVMGMMEKDAYNGSESDKKDDAVSTADVEYPSSDMDKKDDATEEEQAKEISKDMEKEMDMPMEDEFVDESDEAVKEDIIDLLEEIITKTDSNLQRPKVSMCKTSSELINKVFKRNCEVLSAKVDSKYKGLIENGVDSHTITFGIEALKGFRDAVLAEKADSEKAQEDNEHIIKEANGRKTVRYVK